MPFANVKVSDSYYLVPTQNPSWRHPVNLTKQPIGLTIERIDNPGSACRDPVATAAIPIDDTWTNKGKNPNDKNTAI